MKWYRVRVYFSGTTTVFDAYAQDEDDVRKIMAEEHPDVEVLKIWEDVVNNP